MLSTQTTTSQAPTSTSTPSPCFPSRPIPIDRWRGEYFNNRDLSGGPALVRDDGVRDLDFEWGLNGPSRECAVTIDDFSVRWTRTVAFASGSYRFTIISDDGARLLIDGQEKFSNWREHPLTENYVDLMLSAGNHTVILEYFEHFGSAVIKLSWGPQPCLASAPADHWKGEYFNSDNLSGRPVMIRDDGDSLRGLDFAWGENSPAPGCNVRAEGFSARWSGEPIFDRGFHRFTIVGSGGLRVFIDGQLKVDQWKAKPQKHSFDLELSAGRHPVVVEYADFGGRAAVKLSWRPPPCIATVPTDHWRGEYFSNRDLTGRPSIIRDEGAGMLDFDWGLFTPSRECLSITDGFSVHWTRRTPLDAGTYRFTVTADDGVRLFVDGQKLIDAWRDQMQQTYTVDLELNAGPHRITLEYYKNLGSAAVKLSWAAAPCTAVVPVERWRGEYFNNTDLSGKPALVRDEGEEKLDFDWGLKSPDSSCGVSIDNFSARWTRTATFGEGLFRFTVAADDGVRVYIDRQLKFERWTDQTIAETFDLPMTSGNHLITVEYFERWGSAKLKFSWQRHPCFDAVDVDHWRGEYFNNPDLNGQPVRVRDDGDGFLSFDWGAKSPSPDCNVFADSFSARWTRKVILPTGTYRFTVTGDDGVKLFVNRKKLIDKWRNQKSATYTADIFLPAGTHRIVFEFYEQTGEATIKLSWQTIGKQFLSRPPDK